MIFGPTPLDDAEGAVLAHTHRLAGLTLKKGAALDGQAVAALRQAGRDPVIAARLEPGDIAENEAAARLAHALAAPNLDLTRAATGRVNLIAAVPGLLRARKAAIDALNQSDEALTLATLPDWASVSAGDMVATIKVIPFAVSGGALNQALAQAPAAALALHPYQPRRVGLVMTRLPGLKPSILAATADVTRARVEALGGDLLPSIECDHATAPIAAALTELQRQGADIFLVAGASAVVDRRDVGPEGIVAAGGEILQFGMPVDPGNLICLGRIGARPALVLPGCARSPKLNGIDWVLRRLFAGLSVSRQDVAAMGSGGLLQDAGPRPLPRAKAAPASTPAAPPEPRSNRGASAPVAAIILAAGASSRMGARHKLLIRNRAGVPMLAQVADNVLAAPLRPVIAVLGHRASEMEAALAALCVQRVYASNWQAGLAASLRAGIEAVPPDAPAALVCLGDMPLVTPAIIVRLLQAYDPARNRLIVAPIANGALGNPVLWDRRFFPEILALSGDRGARALLEKHADHLAAIPFDDDAVLRDVDTPEQLADLPDEFQPA